MVMVICTKWIFNSVFFSLSLCYEVVMRWLRLILSFILGSTGYWNWVKIRRASPFSMDMFSKMKGSKENIMLKFNHIKHSATLGTKINYFQESKMTTKYILLTLALYLNFENLIPKNVVYLIIKHFINLSY